MGRSLWRCKAPRCPGVLGAVDRYSKAFHPGNGVTSIAHGISVTLVCPECGRPRVFTGWTVTFERPAPCYADDEK